MRGQDLLEERRACPRQSHNENRRGARAADALPGTEKLGRTYGNLQMRIALGGFRAVTAFRLFERIAALVVSERCGVLAIILERLAECEAKMNAVGKLCTRGRLRGAHAGDLIVREMIGLEVGEAPIRIPIAWPGSCRSPIGLNGFVTPSECLQRVCHGKVNLGRLRRLDEQFAVELD